MTIFSGKTLPSSRRSGNDMRIEVSARTNAKFRRVDKMGENQFVVHTPITPEDGKANKDIIEQLSDFLEVPRSRMTIVKGANTKKKVIEID
jgi:uncharacterized protein YggU (UPF0235/DUF167 family)